MLACASEARQQACFPAQSHPIMPTTSVGMTPNLCELRRIQNVI